MSSQTFQDEGSFVILGTSPQQSLRSIQRGSVVNGDGPMMSDLPDELMDIKPCTPNSSLPFKAHFDLSKTPSPSSLMIASSLVSNQSIDQLQTKFAKVLDENLIFKETLRQNHASMKDQLQLISSYQEDMLQTHQMHKEKFEQTTTLMHKLRAENAVLKEELGRLKDLQITKSLSPIEDAAQNGVDDKKNEVTSSVYEFVASPDEDTINKLTAQIELVEKQRRQLITDNEKLVWQKESLEHLIDATSKERDDLKQKVKDLELAYSKQQVNHDTTMKSMTFKLTHMEAQLQQSNSIQETVIPERLFKDEQKINSLEEKIASTHSQLKSAQLKIRELENAKLEHSRQKHDSFEVVRQYKEQLQEVQERLRQAQTVVFQPVRSSLDIEQSNGTDYADFANNIRLYDKTLKHIAEFLNFYTDRGCDFLNSALQIVGHIQEVKSDPEVKDEVMTKMSQLKSAIHKQQASSLEQKIQIKASLSIFEKMFKDYQQVLSRLQTGQRSCVDDKRADARLKAAIEERDVARAQADVYRIDFEAERESRQKLVTEKEQVAADLRQMQRRNQDLTTQLEDVRRLNPNIYRSATRAKPQESIGQVFVCPKCNYFTLDEEDINQHVDRCLNLGVLGTN